MDCETLLNALKQEQEKTNELLAKLLKAITGE